MDMVERYNYTKTTPSKYIIFGGLVKCPYCDAEISCSLFFADEVECPECGKKFQKDSEEKPSE